MNVKSISFYAAVILMILLMFAVSYAVNMKPTPLPKQPYPQGWLEKQKKKMDESDQIWIDSYRRQHTLSPDDIIISGGVSGEWMSIIRMDKKAAQQRGFDPSYTMIVSNFQPIVQVMDSGRYEITFTSPITKDLP